MHFVKIIADTHCHTISSGHAYSTLEEMVKAAKKQGLFAIAVTDHSLRMVGAPEEIYFENLRILPEYIDGIRVIRGIEANVCDYEGNLDTTKNILNSVEWVVASMHPQVLDVEKGSEEKCTNAWLNVAKNPRVNVIGHSGQEKFKFDYEKVIKEFKKNGKLVEINNSSFKVRPGSEENCKLIAKLCKENEVPIIVNSDAHFSSLVGKFDNALNMLKEIDFPEELIVNSSIERFKAYLKKCKINF